MFKKPEDFDNSPGVKEAEKRLEKALELAQENNDLETSESAFAALRIYADSITATIQNQYDIKDAKWFLFFPEEAPIDSDSDELPLDQESLPPGTLDSLIASKDVNLSMQFSFDGHQLEAVFLYNSKMEGFELSFLNVDDQVFYESPPESIPRPEEINTYIDMWFKKKNST